MALDHHTLIFTFGVLGNIISVAMFLSPMPTFFRVIKKKSTEGFQSIPYVVALLSCSLWIYYAILKSNDYLLLSINCVGSFVETIYIFLYILYAPKKARMLTLKMVFVLNFGGFLGVFCVTHFFTKGPNQLQIVGWCCVVLSIGLFAAPLTIMRLVILTKSVEYMPFTLSFFLTLSAVMWLLYGLLLRDLYVGLPNIFGLVFGIAQMVLYAIYKNCKSITKEDNIPSPRKVDGPIVKLTPMTNSDLLVSISDGGKEEEEEQKKSNGERVTYQVQQVDVISV